MAQFRTTSDIMDLALQNAGEVTNGNSPYEPQALNFLNKVHHAMISGGTIPVGKDATVQIDELWPWSRAKRPLILDLVTKFTTGGVTLTNGSELGQFSEAPTISLQGRHLRVVGRSEWLKIAKHEAGSSLFEFDGIYPDDSGAGLSYEVVKLDYELTPQYIVIDQENNKIQFQEVAGTTLTATLTSGTYTPSGLCTEIQTQLNATGGTPAYTVTYSTITKKFTIASNRAGGAVFVLVGTGDQSQFSIHKTIGMDDENTANAASVTSAYILGGISRLVEPIKLHKCAGEGLFGVDPETFNRNYPLAQIEEGQPDRFCIIREDADGSITIRLNGYPATRTRAEVEHVSVPRDLKDSSASIPIIPRKHIDILEDAATFYLMLNKSDDRAQIYSNLLQGKLNAMIAQNRGTLLRSGRNFGQIIPRRDNVKLIRKPFFGYPTAPASSTTSGETAQVMAPVTLTYVDFQTASTTITKLARTLAANRTLFALIIKLNQSFSGGSISALSLDVGITGDTDKFILGFDAMQAVSATAQDSNLTIYYPTVATAVNVLATATGDNLSALTQGSVTLYFYEAVTE